jgi:hypothetical protein
VRKSKRVGTIAIATALVSALGVSAMSAQDKYTVKVPGGLAFSEFRGYEAWQVSPSVRTATCSLRSSRTLS